MSGSDDEREAGSPAEEPEAPLPESLIPRWLAAGVLVALLAAGACSAWFLLTGEPAQPADAPPVSAPRTGSPAAR